MKMARMRRDIRAALRESEARFRTMADTAPAMLWVTEPDGSCSFLSRGWYEFTGQTEEEALGKQGFGWLDAVHPDDRAQAGRIFLEANEKQESFTLDYRLRRVDGEYRWAIDTGRPRFGGNGEFLGYIGSVLDVTERKQTEEALRRLNDELEQRVADRTKDLMQSQNRLRAMATELNLAEQRERKRIATELHDHLQQTLALGRLIVGQGKRVAAAVPASLDVMMKLDDIFSEALTYTRTLVADLSPPVLRDHGLSAGLKWLGQYMKKHQITVTVTVPEKDDLKLPEDQAVLLFQSVRELLINSSKYAGTRQADVKLEGNDGQLRIEVSDQGIGFDLAAAAAAAAAAAGTPSGGISSKFGLFSIRERMLALGGSFGIESAPGKGTIATLVLPLGGGAAAGTEDSGLRTELSRQAATPHVADRSSRSGHSVLSTQENAPLRVLLVDDHPMMRQGLRSIVTASAHLEVVGEAGDGAEAVGLAQRLDPDVVVMDINMPKMDGIEATRQIKANQPATVIIGLSVNQSADTEQKMKAAGAFTYLTKESALDALCHAIEQAVSYKQHTGAPPAY